MAERMGRMIDNLADIKKGFDSVMKTKAEIEELTWKLRDDQRKLISDLIAGNLEECLTVNYSAVRRYLNHRKS